MMFIETFSKGVQNTNIDSKGKITYGNWKKTWKKTLRNLNSKAKSDKAAATNSQNSK